MFPSRAQGKGQTAVASRTTHFADGCRTLGVLQLARRALFFFFFGGGLEGISESTFQDIIHEAPSRELELSKLAGGGELLLDLLVYAGLSASKGQARKDIEGGGVYVNNVRESSFQRSVTTKELLFGKHLLLRKGKRNYVVVTAK